MSPTDSAAPVLVCSAGDETTRAVLDEVASLLTGRPVTVMRAWRSAEYTIASSTAAVVGTTTVDYVALDDAIEGEARDDAEKGAEYARSLGLDADSEAVRADKPVWRVILDRAEAHGAGAIVTSTRGHGDIESAFIGSTSHALLQHSTRPVIVVNPHPSPVD
jgi:nucleotide-binding universal stress UspA family protein